MKLRNAVLTLTDERSAAAWKRFDNVFGLCWKRMPVRSTPMKAITPIKAGAVALLLSAAQCTCAQQPPRSADTAAPTAADTGSRHTGIDYSKYVVRTVGMFSFSSLYDWDSNDPSHAVVWTTPFEAYRLTLLGPCFELQHAPIIALTSNGGTVTAGLDSVLVRGDRCTIQTIEKLDAKAISAARKQKRD